MKNIVLFFSIMMFSSVLHAQNTSVNDISVLKTELDTIVKNKFPINSIALSPAGDWTIIYGDIGYSFINSPENTKTKIKELNEKKRNLKDLDFFKNGWLLLAEDNAFFGDSVPEGLATALRTIHNDKQRINSVSFMSSDIWVVLYERNAFMHNGLPDDALRKLQNLNYRNQYIKQIEFTPNGKGWIILYASKGFAFSNLPTDVVAKIKELDTENKAIDRIFFFADKWVITTEKSGYFSNL